MKIRKLTTSLMAGACIISLSITSITAFAQNATNGGPQQNKLLLESPIDVASGSVVSVRDIKFPAGWRGPKHHHSADLFIHVIDGQFEVTLEGSDSVIYKTGDAFQMKTGISMEGKNLSATEPLKLSVFQIGALNSPFIIPDK